MRKGEMAGYKILVIEDNPGDFYLIKDFLKEYDTTEKIVHAATFNAAREQLNTGHVFDVILLDLTLPDARGEELIKKIASLSGEAIIIILTGYSDMQFSIKSLNIGVSDYMIKEDLTAETLLKSIRYGIERKSASYELKKSEERYRKLFELNPNSMVIYSLQTGQILDINLSAVKQYGFTRDEFKKLSISDIRIDEEPEELENRTQVHLPDQFWVHKKKNGDHFFAEVNSTHIEYKGDLARLDIIRDISEKFELYNQMVEKAVQAEEDERNRIAKDLHDSIVQKLAACAIHLDSLQAEDYSREELKQKLQMIYENVREITNETRDISHNLRSAETEIQPLYFIINQLVKQLSRDTDVEFTLKNHLPESDDYHHHFKTVVYRILQELCNNILKHSQATLATVSIDEVNNRLYLTVRDNGIGFDEKEAQRRGIGLWNVKSRVYKLGGEISFEKNADERMLIHIELPIKKAE